jgi:hypothetical protein
MTYANACCCGTAAALHVCTLGDGCNLLGFVMPRGNLPVPSPGSFGQGLQLRVGVDIDETLVKAVNAQRLAERLAQLCKRL